MSIFDLITTGEIGLTRQATDNVTAEIVGVKPCTLRSNLSAYFKFSVLKFSVLN
jgi:hypothetical protein